MSIVPASRLSSSDMAILGNNLRRAYRQESVGRTLRRRRLVAAVNRSLSTVGERVSCLHRPLLAAS